MTQEERAAWLEERRKSLGASDVPAVLGFSKWADAYTVWASKKHGVDGEAGEPARWGNRNEAAVFEGWLEDLAERDLRAFNVNTYNSIDPGLIRPDGDEWAHATPDRIVRMAPHGTHYVVQIKTARTGEGWARQGGIDASATGVAKPSNAEGEKGTVPDAYYLQVLWEMWVAKQAYGEVADVGFLVVLVAGCELRSYRVEYDEALVQVMVDTCRQWWADHVAGDAVPTPGARSQDAILGMHPTVRGRVDLDKSNADAIAGYVEAQRLRRLHSDRADTFKAMLLAELGDAAEGIVEMPLGDRKIVRQSRRDGRYGPYAVISIRDAGNRRPTGPAPEMWS